MKLNDRWFLFELLRQHSYIISHGYNNKPYPKKVERSEKQIILATKKILQREIKKQEIELVNQDIDEYFFKELLVHPWGNIPPLGPIGGSQINTNNGQFLDLNDIQEVYVYREDFSGSILTKSCGWVSWINLKNEDNTFQYIVTMNHFKQDSSRKELYEKVYKYKSSKIERKFKNFFISKNHWFHNDLEKLWASLPYVNFLNY